MSHVIAPEVTIDSTPLLIELCSDDFKLESLDLSLEDLEVAAESIKEACSISSKAINNAKANILLAYMAEPSCKRWLKTEFSDRVDCDNGLLAKMAKQSKFRFYTNEKLIVEDIDNNGEETPNEVIAQRTGVPAKVVARVKNKIQKKREEAEIAEKTAIQEALAADNDDSSRETAENMEATESAEASIENEESQSHTDIEPIAENRPGTNEPDVDKARSLPSIEQVDTITEQVKTKVEEEYIKEIDELKSKLSEKDAEIARLMALLGAQS